MLEKLIRQLVERRAAMERDVFFSPPADMAAFQKRLGAYAELEELIQILNTAMKGQEHDE